MIHRPVHVVLCRGAFPPPFIKREVDLLYEFTKTADGFFLALPVQLGDDSINQHSRVRLRQLRDQANRFASALTVNPPHRDPTAALFLHGPFLVPFAHSISPYARFSAPRYGDTGIVALCGIA
jgi:hypothetical protein